MIKGGKGGAKTLTGLKFEKRVDIRTLLKKLKGYKIKDHDVYFEGKITAQIYQKHDFYKKFLEPQGVDWTKILSTRLLPDQVIFILTSKTLYVVEMKFQNVPGSVDEKLQTCNFKKEQYAKLVEPLNIKIEYVYILSDWFNTERYRDSLNYVKEVGCHYFFNELPLSFLGLPLPK